MMCLEKEVTKCLIEKKKKTKHIHEHYCSQNRKGRESHFNTKEQFNTHNDITKTSYDDTAGST